MPCFDYGFQNIIIMYMVYIFNSFCLIGIDRNCIEFLDKYVQALNIDPYDAVNLNRK